MMPGSLPASIEYYLDEQRALIDRELDRLLPPADAHPASIHRAMRHSVLAGGKRLRPLWCLEAGRLFEGDESVLMPVACALEMIHTYSLIHDDLPALDNDDWRRGQPTCHRAFGEATAILAGDALLTLAFEVLAAPLPVPPHVQLAVIRSVARAIGTRDGMIGGQVVDLETTGKSADAPALHYIHSSKTGALICAAVCCGALLAQAGDEDLARLAAYGQRVGLAFQIADDLLDVLGSRDAAGKRVGKDDEQHKATYPAVYGIEESQSIACRLVAQACQELEPYGPRADRLRQIARFLIERNH
jgi:geranylgeranyl diphosphate synthase type II